jgi:hypothetical protein
MIDPSSSGRLFRLNAAFEGERDTIDALTFERVLRSGRDEKTLADGAGDGCPRGR